MTEKRCTDCKYTKGIGYDFWCGEGHTEYEVFGAETNCPYYEYHDWSKGTPSRTEKRFKIVDEQFISYYGGNGYLISNEECKIWLWHSKEGSQKVCDKLNSILDENELLKQDLAYWKQQYNDLYESEYETE